MPRSTSPLVDLAPLASAAALAAPWKLMIGLALATLVAEDLTCIAGGILVAHEQLSFLQAAVACFFGIFLGDLLLVVAGRWLGRPALLRRPLSWLVTPESVERSGRWFARRGPRVVFISRFFPGSRLPLFVAAGVLKVPVGPLAAAMAVAGLIWTPALVGLSAATGGAIRGDLEIWERRALPLAIGAALLVLLILKVVIPAFTWRGRRMLLSRWRRWTRWEFWPLALFQLPVVLNWLRLGIRHRHLALFTAANPGIPAGGFVLESKSEILAAIGDREVVPRFVKLVLPDAAHERVPRVLSEHAAQGFGFPVVGKPDVGERGEGVVILRDAAALEQWARLAPREAILQEYVPGEEFGVFYIRRPGAATGELFSITRKAFPTVTGDGRRTLEELILADDRAVCLAKLYLEKNAARLDDVPAPGEHVRLVEIGNHCRGTVFHDGRALATPQLAARIEAIARSLPGFHFGRLDLRAPSLADFQAGRGLRVLEVNGVTSEATHIYEPGASLFEGYRTLFRQWGLAFAIGAANVRDGAHATSFGELLHLLGERRRRAHAASAPPSGAP